MQSRTLAVLLVSLAAVACNSGSRSKLASSRDAATAPQYAVQGSVDLAPSTPLLTAVDPFANPAVPIDPLKPARPYWYAVDHDGISILRIADNSVIRLVPFPATIDVAQTDGSYVNVPAPAGGWEPVAMAVSYPTEEQLASNSETPVTNVYVVMAHSGYEWASDPLPPDLRSPNLRDTLQPATSAATESSMLVALDVTDPTYDPVTYPMGPLFAAAILGHGAGQPAFDPGTGSVYVGNLPSTSLPTPPAVPNDLTSFVSVIFGLASPMAEAAEGGEAGGASITVLCGPEHPEEGILAGVPEAWPCIAEGGEGPFQWEFTSLPPWLIAHPDKLTGLLDGILYGTPPVDGSFTFQARVTDLGAEPPTTSDWTAITLNVMPTGVIGEAEAGWEVGIPAATAIEGTGSCALAATSSPGSLVPEWIDVVAVPGRQIANPTVPGGTQQTIGCVVMGTAPISGEYYEFGMPGFKFAYPFDREAVIISGQVNGPYMFTPVPAGVSLSGLAWHQIEKIHDPSTEADILNAEFFGVEPFTGQLNRILLPWGELEVGDVVAAPATQGELDEVGVFATSEEILAALTAARPDIADVLAAHPSLKVEFGNLVVEASPNPNIYVTVRQLLDPTGADTTVIPVGGPPGSELALGALLKVSGVRDVADHALVTVSTITPIALPGVQPYHLGLNSNLAPAIPGTEPGQIDRGVLWVTGPSTGNAAVVDTAGAKTAQLVAVPGAASLGGVSVHASSASGFTYAASPALNAVAVLAPGAAPASAPVIWSRDWANFRVGWGGSFLVTATGSPTPTLSASGLPSWATFTDHGDGAATLAGIPTAVGTSPITIIASNGVSPDATQSFTMNAVQGPMPVLAAVSPGTGSTLGGTVVTVTGTGFGPGASVRFGDVWGSVTSSSGETSLVVTAPAHAAGTVDVTVSNFDGMTSTLANAFVYVNPPATGVTLSTDKPSPQAAGPIVFTATATGSTGYQYRFYARAPGATSYAMVQDYGAANAWTLPVGSAPGQWAVLVYVRTNAAVLVDAQAYRLFTLQAALPPATGVTLSTSLASPQPAGTPVVFTATGTGSSGYQYRFYARAPGATSYTMVQDYGAPNTWTLSTTTAGQWAVLVYVRTNPSVLVDKQAYKLFTIQSSPATGVTLTTSLSSPQPSGTPVVFTATGQGSSGYQYRFYAKAPGATSYSMVQDYGAANTWTLSTSTVGQWSVLVYVRTNPNVLVEAQAYKLFTIRNPPATGVTISTSLSSPQPTGLPIVFTAAGQGSSGYQYRFYAKAPGATSYTMVQEYGVGSSWTLPAGSAPGQWAVLVYVRTSSNVLVDAQGYRLFTLFAP